MRSKPEYLPDRLDLAWLGLVQYWEAGGGEGDLWQDCDQQEQSSTLTAPDLNSNL